MSEYKKLSVIVPVPEGWNGDESEALKYAWEAARGQADEFDGTLSCEGLHTQTYQTPETGESYEITGMRYSIMAKPRG